MTSNNNTNRVLPVSEQQFNPSELLEAIALHTAEPAQQQEQQQQQHSKNEHVIFCHGNNVALHITSYNATLITTEYPICNKQEVEGLLECYTYGQEVPSTNFLHYGVNDLVQAYETYQAMNRLEDLVKLAAAARTIDDTDMEY